jgi:hypothetical protein
MRRPTPPQFFRVVSTTSLDSRRITFEPESLLVEMREIIGGWQATEEIFWDEVRAVYTWSAPNWNTLTLLALLIGVVGAVSIAVMGATSGGWVAAGMGVSLAAAAFVTIWMMPRQWYRVESSRPPLLFTTQKKETLDELLSHLAIEGRNANNASEPTTSPDAPFASPTGF